MRISTSTCGEDHGGGAAAQETLQPAPAKDVPGGEAGPECAALVAAGERSRRAHAHFVLAGGTTDRAAGGARSPGEVPPGIAMVHSAAHLLLPALDALTSILARDPRRMGSHALTLARFRVPATLPMLTAALQRVPVPPAVAQAVGLFGPEGRGPLLEALERSGEGVGAGPGAAGTPGADPQTTVAVLYGLREAGLAVAGPLHRLGAIRLN